MLTTTFNNTVFNVCPVLLALVRSRRLRKSDARLERLPLYQNTLRLAVPRARIARVLAARLARDTEKMTQRESEIPPQKAGIIPTCMILDTYAILPRNTNQFSDTLVFPYIDFLRI
jgi:hypothetical protein